MKTQTNHLIHASIDIYAEDDSGALAMMSPDAFIRALQSLDEYSQEEKAPCRITLQCRDITQNPYTGSLIQYAHATTQLGHQCEIAFTLDPTRFNDDYWLLVNNKIHGLPHVKLDLPLSRQTASITPEALSSLVIEKTGLAARLVLHDKSLNEHGSALLSSGMSAADYAVRYYYANPESADRLIEDYLARFMTGTSMGQPEFLHRQLRIDHDLNLHAEPHTIWGPLNTISHNKNRLGNLGLHSLSTCLKQSDLEGWQQANNRGMASASAFACPRCDFFRHCSQCGVGLARELYPDVELHAATCFGPKEFLRTQASKARRVIPILGPRSSP